MPTRPRVLLIEDSDDAARILEARLRATHLAVNLRRVATGPSFRALIEAEHWDALVARDGMPALDPLDVLHHVRSFNADLPCVIIVAAGQPERAESARAAGATAVISGDDDALLIPLLRRILRAEAESSPGLVSDWDSPAGATDALLDQLPIIFWTTDAQLRLTRIQGAALPADMARETILGQHVSTVVNTPATVHERVLTGEIVDLDFVLMGRTYHGHLEPIRDAHGQVAGVLGLAIDLTSSKDAEHALRESEQRYRSLFETTAHGVLFVDAKGTLVSVNPAAARILGRPLARLLGRSIADPEWRAVHEDGSHVQPGQRAALHALSAGRDVKDVVVGVFNAADGDYRWVLESATLQFHPHESAPFQACVTWQDITEARRARLALRQSEALFRSLTENASDIVAILDAHGVVQYQSASWQRVLGYAPGHLVGRSGLDSMHPDDVDGAKAQLARVVAEPDGRATLEVRFRHADGSWRILEATVSNLLWDPNVRGIVVNARDITERRAAQAERERAAEQVRFQAKLLNAVGQAVAAIDMDGRITYWNRSAERLYGYSAEEVLGTPIADHLVPFDHSDEAATIVAKLQAGETWTGEFPIRRKDGSTLPGLVSDSPVFDEQGNITGYIGVTTDLTDYRQLEERLRQAQKLEAVGRLAGGVAHDFNNLLTAILGGVAFLLDDFPEPGPVRSDLERIQRAAERAAVLTRQLLAFSRMQMLQPRVIDVNRIVRDVEGLLASVLRDDIEVSTRLAAHELYVRADPAQIEQVLLNVGANARDAMPGGGRLTIAVYALPLPAGGGATREGEQVVIEVADTGAGMTPEVQAQIFEPFFTTREPGQGTGLGLSTAYGIISQSGGSIDVESAPGKGSAFRIMLPRVAPALSEPAVEPAAGAACILLVEDDAIVRTLASRALRNAGYTVLEAGDAAHAMQLAQDSGDGIDLLFTDIVMPGRSGRELAEQFGELWPETPILFTSGFTDDMAVRDAVQGDDIDLLEKPYSPTTLVQRVQSALTSHRH